eukprot:1161099-Pelagomonas_calceolata.AAC.2
MTVHPRRRPLHAAGSTHSNPMPSSYHYYYCHHHHCCCYYHYHQFVLTPHELAPVGSPEAHACTAPAASPVASTLMPGPEKEGRFKLVSPDVEGARKLGALELVMELVQDPPACGKGGGAGLLSACMRYDIRALLPDGPHCLVCVSWFGCTWALIEHGL